MKAVISETSTGRSLLLGDDDVQKTKRVLRTDDDDEEEFDPSKYRPKHRERAIIKINDKEMAKLKRLYSQTIVHDFGDMYHLTNEERLTVNDKYPLFEHIRGVRSKYRKLDDFVVAYRKVLYVVKEIAKTNKVMEPEVFEKKVIKGKINISGVRFPKLTMPKKKRKELNWGMITDYILNPELDVSDLVRPLNPKQDWTTIPEDPEKEMQWYFGMSYNEYIKDIHQESTSVDFEDPDEVERIGCMVPMSRLEFLKIMRENKEFGAQLKETVFKFRKFTEMERRLSGDEDSYGNTVFDVTYDDINTIRDMDEERNLLRKQKKVGGAEFNGNFLDSSAVNRFLFEADEKLQNKIKVKSNDGYQTMTLAQYKEEVLRETLEKYHYNIRKLYGIGKEEKQVKKKVSKEAKRLKRIKKMLTKADNRKRKTKMVGFSVKRVEDDKVNSDKKKKSKKQKKRDKKKLQSIEQYAVFESAYNDFADYEEAMLNFDE